jgi:hypothetical protein
VRSPSSLTLVLALAVAGCASYPQRTDEAFRAFQGGHFEKARELYADPDVTRAAFLEGAESGTAALAAGDWAAAQAAFHRAAESVRDFEDRALVSASSFAEGLSSWALNDTTLPYHGEGFERVYVHACLGLTYLAQGKLQDVLVEVRRANALLEAEEELYEKEYRAGGLGHFLSATTYELLGDRDDAYIDYRRMQEKGVGTQLAGRALVRIANELGWAEDVARWEEEFGPDLDRPAGAASIVVIAGVGTGPFKEEGSLILPTPDGVIPFTVPSYALRPQPVGALRLALGTGESVRTDELESVVDVAQENLSDRVAWMAAKSVARGVLKRELTKKLEEEWDVGGRVLGDVFAIVSERADLRAWQTLPAAWHACRLFVPPGTSELTLDALGGGSVHLGAFELEPGETLVILARSVQGRLYAHAIGGRPVAVLDPEGPKESS